ncbi:MAG TPA: hypothetical protein PK402_08710 [Tepidisphaeraceae bacterium]|nr:hypothetical protein [Tepidisphaeraceae bacterium]
MNNDIASSTQRLRELSPRVLALDEQARQTVDRVETFLRDECRLELPASTLVARDADNASEVLLSYDRHHDAFKLWVVLRSPQLDERNKPQFAPDGTPIFGESTITAWKDCDRTIRMMSFAKLPELLNQLTMRVEQTIEVSERAATAGAQLLAAMNGSVKS